MVSACCLRSFRQGVPDASATVKRIERVQNWPLWTKYSLRRSCVLAAPRIHLLHSAMCLNILCCSEIAASLGVAVSSTKLNEKQLFHGQYSSELGYRLGQPSTQHRGMQVAAAHAYACLWSTQARAR